MKIANKTNENKKHHFIKFQVFFFTNSSTQSSFFFVFDSFSFAQLLVLFSDYNNLDFVMMIVLFTRRLRIVFDIIINYIILLAVVVVILFSLAYILYVLMKTKQNLPRFVCIYVVCIKLVYVLFVFCLYAIVYI